MFPGTVFWKELLNTDPGVKKFKAQLVSAEIDKKLQGRADVVDANRNLGGKTVPSLANLSQIVSPGTTGYRAYNELYPFLDGKRLNPYLKQWDYKETEGATATSQAFVPGSSSATKDIGGFEFGMEICFDHFNGALKSKNGPEVDLHIVVSDCVDTKEANMHMKDGGYFIHASSDSSETCVYKKTGSTKTKLTPTPAIASNQMSYWLVDIDKRVSTPSTIVMPVTPPVVGKKPPGAVKVMFG
jgi:hypothetical protein